MPVPLRLAPPFVVMVRVACAAIGRDVIDRCDYARGWRVVNRRRRVIQDLRAISGAVVGAVAVGCNHGASRCPDRTADDGTVSAADRAADRGA